MMKIGKFEAIPLIFIICATLLLSGLGAWQLQRLQWKNALIQTIEQAQAQETLGTLPQEEVVLDYRKAALTGRFMHDKTFYVVSNPVDHIQGFKVITPLVLDDDGRVILVNRGFSPRDKESKPDGVQTVQGVLRPPHQKRTYFLENKPAENVWFFEDIGQMATASNLTLQPYILEATGEREKNVFPIPNSGKITLRNDHLGYAITWFILAIIGVGMFAVYVRKQSSET